MLWVKALHVVFMVTWFAGLFYLPRIFVYHSQADAANKDQIDTFKIMERKLLIMTHLGGILTIVFGTWLLVAWLPGLATLKWMQIKLLFVLVLIGYHLYCIKLVKDFKQDRNTRTHRWYRLFNEIPVLFLFVCVVMVIVRPFN